MHAFSLQLFQHFGFLALGHLTANLRSIGSGFLDPALLFFAQLVPGGVGDDQLHGAQGVAVHHEVGSDFLEGVALVVGGGLLSGVDHAGLQRAVQFGEGHSGGGSAQAGNQTGHDGVGAHADLQALQGVDVGHFILEEEMTEAFLAVAQAAQGQADGLGLIQEFLGQIAVREVPEMIAVFEHIGQAQQGRLGAAVLAQREGGDAADVGHGAAAQQVVQNLVFGAQHAAGLDVDQHGAAAQLFNLLLEGLGEFADDGALDGVHFSVGQGNRIIRQRGGAAQRQGQNEQQRNQFFHRK